ncbi:MAG: carbamoyltransferase [Bacteroidetes bacterium]|nr:carbamoyltransferase [Bacteroidota bacterium]
MNILGLSAFYHDSAAALVQDGKIVAAAQEERFTRKKHDPGFPSNAIKFCLEFSGLTINDLDTIVFYDKPLLKFERLLETYYGFAPKGVQSFLMSMPVWLKEKMFLKRLIHEELKIIGEYDKKKVKLLFPEHHLSHAASAFYPSPFEEAAILTLDGVGEWATASIGHGKGKDISILKELKFPHSLGLLYSAFTYYLGFKVNSGEYKLMGLAPYGNPESEQTKKYVSIIREKLVDIKDDGSIWLNQEYFNYSTGLRMVHDHKWKNLFGFTVRESEGNLEQHHCDLGLAIQQVTEDVVFKMAAEAKRLTGSENLCLAGGVALNCVANGKLLKKNIFKSIFIQPAAGDAGGALGAALAAYYISFKQERVHSGQQDEMQGSYLGPESGDKEVVQMSKFYKAVAHKFENFDELADEIATVLTEGNVVGWHQGRMEFGPRALGARSILGDARNDEMQKKLNLKIKYRESFRPFAPSVLAEEAQQFFELSVASPYMLLVSDVTSQRRKNLPENYYSLPLMERLYTKRSDVQSITHLDFSARVQTVHKNTNEKYWKLISKFKEKTGYGVLVNTSFNVRGEPIVNTPEDSYRCFMRTEMDYLVINNYVFSKKEQPAWKEAPDDWKKEFKLD